MTLEELREACAKVAENWPATEADRKALGDRVRAIPLPAPVDDELARVMKERDEARYLLSTLHARVSDGHLHTALRAEHSCTAEALDKLRAEVAGLTAALAAAQRERDEARAQIQSTFQQWTRAPK